MQAPRVEGVTGLEVKSDIESLLTLADDRVRPIGGVGNLFADRVELIGKLVCELAPYFLPVFFVEDCR